MTHTREHLDFLGENAFLFAERMTFIRAADFATLLERKAQRLSLGSYLSKIPAAGLDKSVLLKIQ